MVVDPVDGSLMPSPIVGHGATERGGQKSTHCPWHSGPRVSGHVSSSGTDRRGLVQSVLKPHSGSHAPQMVEPRLGRRSIHLENLSVYADLSPDTLAVSEALQLAS